MKILAYNEDGSFNGWYESSIHSTIPEPNIEVPEIVYRQLSSQQRIGQVITVVDGKAELSSPADRVLTWDDIKRQRDGLLLKSDWSQTIDAPITPDIQKAWQVYRQALRDIPETYTNVADVVWPTPPAAS